MSDYLENAEMKMMTAMENLESNLRTIRTGRANAQILDRVQVDYYGSMTPINQMAQIQVVEGTQLVIRPYDRQIIKSINSAIQAANLGLNPQAEADCIRIQIPALTEDRRKELAKEAQKYGEEAKVAIRNIRRDANDQIKKDKEATEDDRKQDLEASQKLTDKFIKDIDKTVEEKKKEILSV
ncbi:ribosome recycling factor [Faecalicoccus acidiformans]|uniref:Ribosome-recycling factor n=1 Tax=Faecalicoccus acidiformans TaxID=915173 RepID=A0A7W8D0Q0_9FIRM|nr:ribosome recycling factor [Faecalicoccus acidiformans]MBB5184544.1 ribosome recycling factor [Faecalicoccus acidiformans]MDM8203996.1 ribosome recycling factor [Faecalicoccus acidiformans]